MKKILKKKYIFGLLSLVCIAAAVVIIQFFRMNTHGDPGSLSMVTKGLIGEVADHSIARFYEACGSYPKTEEAWAVFLDPRKFGYDCDPSDAKDDHAVLSNDHPKDMWGHPLYYKKTDKGFLIKSYGADGKPGGTGENADLIYRSELNGPGVRDAVFQHQ